MSQKETEIKLNEVAAYVHEQYGQKISRATVYNWVSKGRQGNKLRTWKRGTLTTTSKEAVDELIRHCV